MVWFGLVWWSELLEVIWRLVATCRLLWGERSQLSHTLHSAIMKKEDDDYDYDVDSNVMIYHDVDELKALLMQINRIQNIDYCTSTRILTF